MRKLILIAVLASLTACEAIKDEAGYLGGYPERVANSKLFEARSQRQRADRYFMSLAILAPLAADLVESEGEASAAAGLINQAYANLTLMYEAERTCLSGREKAGCDTETEAKNSAFAFETHAYEMQRTLYALSRQTLGNADLDDIADDILALNIVAVYKTLKKAFPIARRLLASYRDTIITFGDAVALACTPEEGVGAKPCNKLKSNLQRMKDGKISPDSGLGAHDDRMVFAMLSALKAASTEQEGGQKWRLRKQHILGLMYHIDRACRSLTMEQLSETSDISDAKNCGLAVELGKDSKSKTSENRNKFKDAALKSKTTKPVVIE